MIIADMQGNIGNQMFIYACARKLQKITGQSIEINTYNLEHHFPDYHFNLDIFKLNENVVFSNRKHLPFWATTESKYYKIRQRLAGGRESFCDKYFRRRAKKGAFVWNGTTYKEITLGKKFKNIYLSGFWQSPEYFDDIREELLHDFELKTGLNEKNDSFLRDIESSNSICVSIRRGDYVSDPRIKNFHYVCTPEYFESAIRKICAEVEDPTLVLFSDDPQWVRENMAFPCKSIYEGEGNSLTDKIILMSRCKHFVLSNSTFSCWVEYLSRYPGKKVIAPDIWYSNWHKADIYQKYWERITIKND